MTLSEKKTEYFASSFGLILSLIGIAVGAGNIWRFARIVAQNGGGSFMIPWVIFLFIWSIPLIITEIAMGKLTRKGPIGALAKIGGSPIGWMGAFIALVTTGILFYYSVVVGWGFSYFVFAISNKLNDSTIPSTTLWNSFIHSFQPFIAHFVSIFLSCFIIHKGIVKGIERANKILIPSLVVMIFLICLRAITLPGAWEGIKYLFTPKIEDLKNFRIWLEALTQNAWDTGAGWGLLLVYAGYAKKRESIAINGCLTAFANNSISLIMGITIFATVFSLEKLSGIQELISGTGSTNIGLTFIYIPKLFNAMPGGQWVHTGFSTIFFLSFSFAALSSLISMVQLTAQVLHEFGVPRILAVWGTGLLGFFMGLPSALSLTFFENQDWVWSTGLILSGLFIAIAVIRFGIDRYRLLAINSAHHDLKLGKIYNIFISMLIPIQAILLLGWSFYQSISMDPHWWNPFHVYSLGTLIFQWGLPLIVFLCLNKWLVKKTLRQGYL